MYDSNMIFTSNLGAPDSKRLMTRSIISRASTKERQKIHVDVVKMKT